MNTVEDIWTRAESNCGGTQTLQANLPAVVAPDALVGKPDREFLSAMSCCIFKAGFAWHVVDAMWPGFEQAFEAFEPRRLLALDDAAWQTYRTDRRIVRNGPKIQSVRENAAIVSAIANHAGGFGRFLATWPSNDLIGLLSELKQRGSRLGRATGARFLKAVGKDCFALDEQVIAGLKLAGLHINRRPTSTRELASIQTVFNQWHAESGLAYQHLSVVVAASTGTTQAQQGYCANNV